MTLEEGFSYEPGVYTGQHSYSVVIADARAYVIGLSVFSDDGANIALCSMRLASALLQPSELAQASDMLWRAARAMIAASDPEATQEDIEALRGALCPDLPAALIRGEKVDASHARQGIGYSLYAGFEADAFYADSPIPSGGYIVDFTAQADVREGAD